mgnify:CR=1 FL=1
MSGKVGDNPYRASGVVACAAGGGGAIDWCTTAKTSPLTADAGSGYFINTTCGAITLTLPSSPTAGDMVGFKDYAGTWDANTLTLGRGGSKINGACCCATFTTQGQAVTMIYVDGTKGWQDVNDSTSDVTGGSFILATGGCISTCGCYKNHKFQADATFNVTGVSTYSALNVVSYLVVAGGGGGGAAHGGGGGAGGYREGKDPGDPLAPSASPLAAACSALTVAAQGYPISVGAGGAGGIQPGGTASQGGSSIFSTITSAGGGLGATESGPAAGAGGSGGGGTYITTAGGAGDTPDVTPDQGFAGGNGIPSGPYAPGGGGGAGAVGTNGSGGTAGPGGAGVTSSITTSAVQRGGGGGGGHQSYTTSAGGCGGAGGGGDGSQGSGITGFDGTIYTGGGGGGGHANCPNPGQSGGTGGKGLVVIRYKYQ